jgi:lipid-binding SYLF domain-containing protein
MITHKRWLRSSAGVRWYALAAVAASVWMPRTAAGQQHESRYAERATRAAQVLAELVAVPDHAPPKSLLAAATCVAVVPRVIGAGLGIGGEVGFGLASCRTADGWSLPTYMGLKGGSLGLQIGGEASDVVLVFVNLNAPQKIARSTLDLGADASVAAGPVGRDVSAQTDYRAQAEIYSYSKSKGLFAGAKLAGTKWEIDNDANIAVYGTGPRSLLGDDPHAVAKLLATGGGTAPDVLRPFLESLAKNVGAGTAK